MFLKKNFKKARSLFSSFAFVGLAAAALFWSANAATPDVKNAGEPDAPTGGTTNKFLDFNGNGTTDFVTLALPAGGTINWHVLGNPANPAPNQALIRRFDYGFTDDDSIVVGDYIGDNKADLAVFRNTAASAPGIFYLAQFPLGTAGVTLDRAVRWGDGFTDTPVPGDYDGDGKVDYAVVRVVSGNLVWYILSSGTNTAKAITFGLFTGVTGPSVFPGADFNGDGRDELVYVNRNSAGTMVNYYIGDANTGAGVITRSFGNFNTDASIAPADYTGDGRADFGAVRETDPSGIAIWYILNSATGAVTATRFGIADPAFTDFDFPLRGDYDGDNRQDIAVWRPSNQTFYWIRSSNNSINSQQFGDPTDTPLATFGFY